MECAITKTPIISTNVGIAPEILSTKSIFDMKNFHEAKPDIKHAFEQARRYTIPEGFEEFKSLLSEIYED